MRTGPVYRLISDSHSEPGSILLTVTDGSGRVVGEARLIVGQIWQLTGFAVQSRDATVAAALCHGAVQALRINRVRDIAIAVDRTARAILAAVGLFAGARSVAQLLDGQRRMNPEGYRLVSQGQGLDDVELPYWGELLTAPVVAPALAG